MLVFNNMIMIGSAGRNSGKTYLALKLIESERAARPVIALKVTGVSGGASVCPRGGAGCGACSLVSDFCLEEESCTESGKDTALLLKAGAVKCYWLRCLRSAFDKGFAAFIEKINALSFPKNVEPLVVCESNSLRKTVKPGLFVMLLNSGEAAKPSAAEVMSNADITVESPVRPADVEKIISLAKNCGVAEKRCEATFGA